MSITEQLPIIIILAPFFAAILISFSALWRRSMAYPLTLVGLSISLVAACTLLIDIAANGARFYDLGGWPAPYGIVLYVDTLNAIVLITITAVALISAVASLGENEPGSSSSTLPREGGPQ